MAMAVIKTVSLNQDSSVMETRAAATILPLAETVSVSLLINVMMETLLQEMVATTGVKQNQGLPAWETSVNRVSVLQLLSAETDPSNQGKFATTETSLMVTAVKATAP